MLARTEGRRSDSKTTLWTLDTNKPREPSEFFHCRDGGYLYCDFIVLQMIQIGVTATEVCYLCSSPAKSGSVPIFSCGSEKKKKKVNAAGM